MTTIHQDAAEYCDLVDFIKELEDRVKALKKDREAQQNMLLERMMAEETPRLTVSREGGRKVTVYPNGRMFASVNADAANDATRALMERLGLDELIRETVNASSLSAAIREKLEAQSLTDGSPQEIAECLGDTDGVLKISNKLHLAVRRG